MRTTIDINDDLMRELKKRSHDTGHSLKDVINSILRRGLKIQNPAATGKGYRCPSFSLGHPASYNLDHALEIAQSLESEEIARKLRLRK
jgi:hypothetical protein